MLLSTTILITTNNVRCCYQLLSLWQYTSQTEDCCLQRLSGQGLDLVLGLEISADIPPWHSTPLRNTLHLSYAITSKFHTAAISAIYTTLHHNCRRIYVHFIFKKTNTPSSNGPLVTVVTWQLNITELPQNVLALYNKTGNVRIT